MITDYSNRNAIRSKEMLKIIIFTVCVLPFPSLVSNVRNILSFAIFIFAAYREFEQNKRNAITYIFYLIPVFIHISAVALLIIRLLIPIYKLNRKRRFYISAGIISSSFLVSLFAYFIQNSALSSNPIISAFFLKADSYVKTTGTEYAIYLQSSTFMSLQKIYFIGIVLFLALILYLMNKYLNKSNKLAEKLGSNQRKMLSFYGMLCMIVLGTAPIVLTVYMRFAFPAIILSFLVLFQINHLIPKKVYRQFIAMGMLLGSLGGLLHQIVFMSKMTNILQMITSVMVRSLLNMFIL
jgi:hypothetical protein